MSAAEGEVALRSQPEQSQDLHGKGFPTENREWGWARGPGMGRALVTQGTVIPPSPGSAPVAGPAVSAISQGSLAALMKQAQLPFAGFLAGPLSWVLNEDVPEPRQGHFELASDCAGVCVFLSPPANTPSDAIQPVARVPVLRLVAAGLITEPEKGG